MRIAVGKRILDGVIAAALAGGAAAQDGEPIVSTGPNFVVEFLPGNLPVDVSLLVANDALAAAEGMWPAIQKAVSVKVSTPPRILVYADTATFRAAERSLSSLSVLVDEVVSADGATAHVPLSPRLGKDLLLAIGLPESTRQAVQRCAVQAVVMQSSAAAQQDPWLAEVIAVGVQESVSNPRREYGVDPLFDQRRRMHQQWVAKGVKYTLAQRLLDTDPPRDGGDYRVRRDNAALIAQLLADTGNSWPRKLLAKSTRSLGVVPYRLAAFQSVLGKDRDRTEARWLALRKAIDPVWTCGGSVRLLQGKLELVGGKEDTAFVGLAADLPPGDYAVCGSFLVRKLGSAEFRIELDWADDNLIAVWIVDGRVGVACWTPKTNWQKPMGECKLTLPPGEPFDLRIEVSGGLRVSINGNEVLQVACKRTWRGLWQVAVNDGALTVADLRVEPLPAK